jgi:hypothetical protein
VLKARLAEQARTRRVPLNGRLDTERYGYVSWSPPAPIPSAEEAYAGLAERYFAWTGSATLAEFKEFCGCTLKEAQFATRELGLVADPTASKHLMLPHLLEEREQFTPLEAPSILFVGNMDSIGLHRRNLGELLDDDDRAAAVRLTEAQGSRNLLGECDSHLILDRGRWIGVWDFDTLRNRLIWVTWQTPTDEVREAAGACERFVRDELADARTSSQDSPQSRSKRIAAIEMLNQ